MTAPTRGLQPAACRRRRAPDASGEGVSLAAGAAHIAGLWAFAIAQPIFDLVGGEPAFLVAHRLSGLPLVALTFVLAVGGPLVLAAPTALHGLRSNRARPFRRLGVVWLHLTRAVLAGAFALQLLHGLPWLAALALAAALGAFVVAGSNRYRPLSHLVAVTAVAALIAPGAFLLRPDIRGLISPESTTTFEPVSGIAEAPRIESTVPVVLIVFDELPLSSLQRRDGTIDTERYPSFAALAAEADWYRRAVTVAMQTFRAIPAILTGRLPDPDRDLRPDHRDQPENLFTWLAASGGYRVVAQETLSRLCPPGICEVQALPPPWQRLALAVDDLSVVYGHLLLPPALSARLPEIGSAWTGFRRAAVGEQTAERRRGRGLQQNVPGLVDDFLERLGERGERGRSLHYLHLNLPHRPWKYLPSGREYAPVGAPLLPPGFGATTLPNEAGKIVPGLKRHLLQVGYADRVLGQVLDRLRRLGVYDRALIVVTADHGMSFRPGERRRAATAKNVEDVLEVPLFIKRPGRNEGAAFDHVVRTVDIVPTIADALGVEVPWPVDGRPVRDPAPRAVSVCCYADGERRREFETDARRRQETLDRLDELFSQTPAGEIQDGRNGDTTSDPFAGVYAAGPRPQLIGRRAKELVATAPSSTESGTPPPRIILAGRHAYADVRPDSGFVPSLVSGSIEPRVADGAELAVAVNGIVRATAAVFTDRGASRFAALIPERRLPAGSHEIDVYAIAVGAGESGSDAATLRLLGSFDQPPRAVLRAGRVQEIALPGGESLPAVDHLFQAEVDNRSGGLFGRLTPGRAELEPPPGIDEFFLFRGAELLYRGEDDPYQRRFEELPDGRVRTTFRIFLPEAALADDRSLRLLVRSGARVQPVYRSKGLEGSYELAQEADGREVLLRRARGEPKAEPERIAVTADEDRVIGRIDGRAEGGGPGVIDSIFGWAADRATPEDSLEVVAFLENRQVGIAWTGWPRSDVAERHGDGYLRTGFRLRETAAAVVGASPNSLRRLIRRSASRKATGTDEAIVRQGVTAFAVTRDGVASRLSFSLRPLDVSLAGAEVLPIGDGRILPIQGVDRELRGHLDVVERTGERTRFQGWAADVERGEAPVLVVVYREGQPLARLNIDRPRPDVAAAHDSPRLDRTGFIGSVPNRAEAEPLAAGDRVFAVFARGVAVELAR